MPRALLVALLTFVLSYGALVASTVFLAGSACWGPEPPGAGLARFAVALVLGWMPALVIALVAWAITFVRTRPAGASTWTSVGVVVAGTAVVASLLLPPGRDLVIGYFFGERAPSVEPLHAAPPGELGTTLATARSRDARMAFLRAIARDHRVLDRYRGTDGAAAADRAAAAAFAVRRLAEKPCSGRSLTTAGPMSTAVLDRFECRILALETLLQVSLYEPVDDRVAWLLSRAPDADLLWYRQGGPDRTHHLPSIDRLTDAERQTLVDTARRRLAAAQPTTTTGPDRFLQAIALQDPSAAAALAEDFLR